MPPIALGRQRSSLRLVKGGVDAGPGRRLTRGPNAAVHFQTRPEAVSTAGMRAANPWPDHVGVHVEAWLSREEQSLSRTARYGA
jgi:hypothetical protein